MAGTSYAKGEDHRRRAMGEEAYIRRESEATGTTLVRLCEAPERDDSLWGSLNEGNECPWLNRSLKLILSDSQSLVMRSATARFIYQ